MKFADIELTKGSKYLFAVRPQTKNGTRPLGIHYTLQIQQGNSVVKEITSQDGDLSYYIFSPAESGPFHLSITYDQKFIGPQNGMVDAFKGSAVVIKYNR